MAVRRPNLRRAEPTDGDGGGEAALALDGFVTVRIVQLAEIISRGASEVFEARFGVKNTELRILVHLAGQPMSVNELGRRTRVDKGWISRSLRAMEKRGMVRRARHPTDGRASVVELTEAGQALVRSFAPVARARNERLLAGLDRAEVHRGLDALLLRAEDIQRNPDLVGQAAPKPGGVSGRPPGASRRRP